MRLSYHSINNLIGFLVFGIAAVVYCLTVEPTASFWDCGEFIISAYKLEVGHPPGAPFFMLTANVFSQFTDDPALVARMINYMSALMSAATIWLLFLTITHLTRHLIARSEAVNALSKGQVTIIMTAGAVGALAYAFSDTFWFSAVEGEVYAYSSLFTALVFWLILKWEAAADAAHSDRWLVLIAYLVGLSIGVHLLNLLCIPAIVLVCYYKRRPTAGRKGSLLALVGSGVLVAVVLYGIVPGVVKVGGWFELLFVNQLGLPFNSGLFAYLFLLMVLLMWGIYESYVCKSDFRMKAAFLAIFCLLGIPFYGYGTSSIVIAVCVLLLFSFYLFSARVPVSYRINARWLNTVMLCLLMIIVGYSSYAVIMIRSSANTPMDQNSPEDIFSLSSYLNREQYGQRPLFYGQAYSSEKKLNVSEDGYCYYAYTEGAPQYIRKVKSSPDEKDYYQQVGYSFEPVYAQNMFFPRMYSRDHANYGYNATNLYKQWVNIKGNDVSYNRCGEPVIVNIPTWAENLTFFFTYQLNYMYWRYFLWNFAGRQNDIQGNGELEHGNWITGIPFIDEWLVGNQSLIPAELKANKGRNVYYCLPLLLGIIGIIWQLGRGMRGPRSFFVLFMLFFMTGIAIVIYLNQTPNQVRERDYAYAGSFYAFAIWIGMGVAGLAHLFAKRMGEMPATLAACLLALFVPFQMLSQTWDDHDRSGRYVARDFGRNYLDSTVEGNHPVIFTSGDNETFPLWYNQEIESYRTDVRICNFAYLQTSWYIDQMRRDHYDSPALPIHWGREQYQTGTAEVIPIRPELKEKIDALYRSNPVEAAATFGDNPYELTNILKYWVRSDDKQLRVIPTDSIVMKLDKEAILRSGMKIPEQLNGQIPEYMHISLKGRQSLIKNEIMMIEIVAGCNWERPVYVATTTEVAGQVCFTGNICQEGLLYRITPFETKAMQADFDSDKSYDLFMNRFRWGGIGDTNVYLDENTMRFCYNLRRLASKLASSLIDEGKQEKALEVLALAGQAIPAYNVPHDSRMGDALTLIRSYYRLGESAQADEIAEVVAGKSLEYINWYLAMDDRRWKGCKTDCLLHFYLLDELIKLLEEYESEKAGMYLNMFNRQYEQFVKRG